MRKAIQLKATLWITGEDEPAHNFAQSTIQAVQEMLVAGAKTHPELQVTLKALTEETDWDSEEGSVDPVVQTAPPVAPPTPSAWAQFRAWLRSVWTWRSAQSSDEAWKEEDKIAQLEAEDEKRR